jgi:hypothetical protein
MKEYHKAPLSTLVILVHCCLEIEAHLYRVQPKCIQSSKYLLFQSKEFSVSLQVLYRICSKRKYTPTHL